MKIKKLICLLLSCVFAFACASCKIEAEEELPKIDKLGTPQNVVISVDGLVSWDVVENADGYYVYVNGEKNDTLTNSYAIKDVYSDCVVYVEAWAESYEKSAASQGVNFTAKQRPQLEISLDCTVDGKQSSTLKSGQTVKFTANISGAVDSRDKKVKFEVENDGAATELSRSETAIEFKGNQVSGDKILKVTAVSEADESLRATKVITVVAKTELTDAMLSALCGDEEIISFDGFVMIDVYKELDLGGEIRETLVQSNTVTMRTAMKTGKWYAEYENASVGISQQIFFEKDDDGYACEADINFKNEISRYPLKTADGSKVLWEDAGYYNCFKGLSVSDFEFNEQTWRWQYKYNGSDLVKNMIASCNPYDFYVDRACTFELIIDDGEIIGICSAAGKDYSILAGYAAKQRLYVALDASDSAVVPEMRGYVSIDDYEDVPTQAEYRKLQEAITNMQALTSYKTTLAHTQAIQGLITDVSGYEETITEDVCFFRPYDSSTDTFVIDGSYGYRKSPEPEYENVYNTFYYKQGEGGDYSYEATRAYRGDMKDKQPSFDFCAEIFNHGCYVIEDGGYTRFVADEAMSNVATQFYSGVGTDINLYGLFAAIGTSGSYEFATYVDIKKVDGKYYIIGSGFYYDISSQGMYGVIDITYSDFNAASISESDMLKIDGFESKALPTSWKDESIVRYIDSENSEYIQADVYFRDYFFVKTVDGVKTSSLEGMTIEELPFFSDAEALGDCFGLGMAQVYQKSTEKGYKAINTVLLYYDVPVDTDYTISSSLEKVDAYLVNQGFVKDSGTGEYRKESCNLVVMPIDESLDFFIYIWVE